MEQLNKSEPILNGLDFLGSQLPGRGAIRAPGKGLLRAPLLSSLGPAAREGPLSPTKSKNDGPGMPKADPVGPVEDCCQTEPPHQGKQ